MPAGIAKFFFINFHINGVILFGIALMNEIMDGNDRVDPCFLQSYWDLMAQAMIEIDLQFL